MERELSKEQVTILLAEDNEDDAFLLKRAFERAGYDHRLICVSDGEEALKYLAGEGLYGDRTLYPFPQLLLLDLGMPLMDGWEVLSRVREEPEWRDLTVIVVTGSSDAADLRRAYGEGADAFLAKRVDFGEYVMAVRKLAEEWLGQKTHAVGA